MTTTMWMKVAAVPMPMMSKMSIVAMVIAPGRRARLMRKLLLRSQKPARAAACDDGITSESVTPCGKAVWNSSFFFFKRGKTLNSQTTSRCEETSSGHAKEERVRKKAEAH